MNLLWRILAPLLLFSIAAAAQNGDGGVRILLYGSKSVKQCAAPVKALQSELQALQFPVGWTMGVVCNSVAWDSILRIASPPPTAVAFSNLIRRSTVINAGIFRQPHHQYRHILAHELGHATCNCADEIKAEEIALKHLGAESAVAKAAALPDQPSGH